MRIESAGNESRRDSRERRVVRKGGMSERESICLTDAGAVSGEEMNALSDRLLALWESGRYKDRLRVATCVSPTPSPPLLDLFRRSWQLTSSDWRDGSEREREREREENDGEKFHIFLTDADHIILALSVSLTIVP